MAGTPRATDPSQVAFDAFLDQARRSPRSSRREIARLAEAAARVRGASLLDRGLRLFVGVGANDLDRLEDLVADDLTSPYLLGRAHELLLAEGDRRRRGVHLTPATVASRLLGCLDVDWGADVSVLDPSVGGGAFLLAAADAKVQAGHAPDQALGAVAGVDIDADAVAVAEAAMALWALGHSIEPQPLASISVGDALLDELSPADVVVGNPPFLNQLRRSSSNAGDRRRALRERWGDLVGAYTDEAWLFLAAAVEAIGRGGRGGRGQVALLQPVSVLSARHGAMVRRYVAERGTIDGLWVAIDRVFEAAVHVCAPIVNVRPKPSTATRPPLRRWAGADFSTLVDGPPVSAHEWGPAGAGHIGVPAVRTGGSGAVGDLATVTAGFRDQFYGFRDHVHESPTSTDEPTSRLVTVGMIDPLRLRWGSADFRFAGSRHTRPVLDLDSLADADEGLAEWVNARRRPKLLAATQSKVVEVWVDTNGGSVPATPVISIEPFEPADVWMIAAALTAPPTTARALADGFGSALSLHALKLSARALAELPLPTDRGAWVEGSELARALSERPIGPAESDGDWRRLGEVMARAYGAGDDLVDWWLPRLPRRVDDGPRTGGVPERDRNPSA